MEMNEKSRKKTHHEWRKDAKKTRRKSKRQAFAQQRDREKAKQEELKLKDPRYLTWLAEQRVLELFEEEENNRIRMENHVKWLKAEEIAQEKFKELKKKMESIELAKAQQKLKIKQEYEDEQKRIQELKEKHQRLLGEKEQKYEILMAKINAYINNECDIPEELFTSADTNPGKPICPFFIKTGACRFGDRCSRNHSRPGISPLLLIPNFFTHIRLDQSKNTEYGADLSLEFDDDDMYKDFVNFFDDVVEEFEAFGKMEQFRVCRNYEPHLRGNVYVEYRNQRDALRAYQRMQGRYYGGKQLNIEFCSIVSWGSAICGVSFANKCPKERTCNFLHVFKNPRNKYPLPNRNQLFRSQRNDIQCKLKSDRSKQNTENIQRQWDDDDDNIKVTKPHWRWSESPEIDQHKSREDKSSKSKRRHRSRSRPKSIQKKKSRSSRSHSNSSRSHRDSRRTSSRSNHSSRRSRSRSRSDHCSRERHH